MGLSQNVNCREGWLQILSRRLSRSDYSCKRLIRHGMYGLINFIAPIDHMVPCIARILLSLKKRNLQDRSLCLALIKSHAADNTTCSVVITITTPATNHAPLHATSCSQVSSRIRSHPLARPNVLKIFPLSYFILQFRAHNRSLTSSRIHLLGPIDRLAN